MSCEVIQRGDLDAYASAELPRAEARRVEVHLFGCAECATELRRLRAEQRLFRMRAEQDTAEAPSFEGVLARLGEDAAEVPSSAAVPPADGVRLRSVRSGGGARSPGWASRLAPAAVAVAALAAAAASWVGVHPADVEIAPGARSQADEVGILPDRVCTAEAPVSSEPLASMPPVRDSRSEPAARTPEDPACGAGARVEACGPGDGVAAEVCGEAVSWCSAGRP